MRREPIDVITADPRRISWRIAWVIAVVLLTAALAGAIAEAVYYGGQVASLRRQLRTVHTAAPVETASLTISSTTVWLPPAGSLTGEVTFFAAYPPAGQASIVVTAHISGGRPHARYTLAGGACSGGSEHPWAAGITDVHGIADLRGPAWRVSMNDSYWLALSPAPGNLEPILAGDFAVAAGISAYGPQPGQQFCL